MQNDMSNQKDSKKSDHDSSSHTPVGTWSKWYFLVSGFLLLQITIYYIITKSFE